MQKSDIRRQIFAAVSASLILIGTGFHLGWAAPSLAKLQAEDSDVFVTPSQGSWIASFLLIGTVCGSILGFILIDRWGRKTTLLLMSIPQCTACLLIAVAKTYWLLYLARFIAGFGSGAILTSIPMYMGEIAEDRIRGGMGILMNLMINLGLLMAFSVGPWVSRTTLGLTGAVIPIVYLTTFVWIPESPYYYAMKRMPHKIEESLKWLRGVSNVDEEVKIIQSGVDFKRKHAGTVTELFTLTGNRKAMIISLGLITCQQVSGITAILSYCTIIFNEVDSGLSSGVIVILIGIVKCSTAIAIVFLADKAGRRPLLLISTTFCIIFLLSQALYFHLKSLGIDVREVSWLPLVATIGYLISFTTGIGTLPMVVCSEIFPVEVKALAMTGNAVYLAATGICVTKFYQIITDAYGVHISYYIFSALSTVSVVFIYLVIPETKKRSLSEIQDELQGVTKPML